MDAFKRSFDMVFSSLLLIILFLPLAVVASISLITQGRPIFLKQKRYGKNGVPFWIYKFRTMKNGVPITSSNEIDMNNITKWGAILRKTSIDELPQLLNVLKGDMSIVGPRPLIVEETDAHKIRKEMGIYSVRPGITGFAQVNGRDDLDLNEKAKLDKEYIDNRSLLFDLKIIFKSVFNVVIQKDVHK